MKMQIMQTLFPREVMRGKTQYSSPNITTEQYMKKDTMKQQKSLTIGRTKIHLKKLRIYLEIQSFVYKRYRKYNQNKKYLSNPCMNILWVLSSTLQMKIAQFVWTRLLNMFDEKKCANKCSSQHEQRYHIQLRNECKNPKKIDLSNPRHITEILNRLFSCLK